MLSINWPGGGDVGDREGDAAGDEGDGEGDADAWNDRLVSRYDLRTNTPNKCRSGDEVMGQIDAKGLRRQAVRGG